MVGVGGVGSVVEGGVSGVWYSNSMIRSVERCEIVVKAIVPGVGNVGDRAIYAPHAPPRRGKSGAAVE